MTSDTVFIFYHVVQTELPITIYGISILTQRPLMSNTVNPEWPIYYFQIKTVIIMIYNKKYMLISVPGSQGF